MFLFFCLFGRYQGMNGGGKIWNLTAAHLALYCSMDTWGAVVSLEHFPTSP